MLDLLQAFVKTAETKSFTRAAEQLGLSKSRVSLRVQTLEQQLGVALLQRSTRTVQLTSAGDELLARARQLLVEADDVAGMFRTAHDVTGELRVDLPVALARTVVIPRLPELFARHPQLQLHVSATDRRVDLVKEGFDCVLRVGAVKDSLLTARKIGSMEMVNAAAPAYLRRFGTPTSPEHLQSHRIVHYGGGVPVFELDGKDIRVPCSLTVNSTDAYQAACLAGIGIIQAPRFGMRAHLASGALVEVLPEHRCRPLPITLVHAQRGKVPKRLRLFMDWLTDTVRAAL